MWNHFTLPLLALYYTPLCSAQFKARPCWSLSRFALSGFALTPTCFVYVQFALRAHGKKNIQNYMNLLEMQKKKKSKLFICLPLFVHRTLRIAQSTSGKAQLYKLCYLHQYRKINPSIR